MVWKSSPLNPLAYQVETPVYQGPLDLLLQLIEHAELDITKVALAQVTDQFLAYLHDLKDKAAQEVSAFLVIASRLMQIKSEALLPRPPEREPGEEDPGEALLRQLVIYKRYKELATLFDQREKLGLRSYLRLAPPPKMEGKLDLSDVSVADLAAAARRAFLEAAGKTPKETLGRVVIARQVNIRDKIALIVRRLRQGGKAFFNSLIGKKASRIEIVVTFLALLELIKRFRVQAQQEELFGDILLEPAEEWSDDAEFELEFAD